MLKIWPELSNFRRNLTSQIFHHHINEREVLLWFNKRSFTSQKSSLTDLSAPLQLHVNQHFTYLVCCTRINNKQCGPSMSHRDVLSTHTRKHTVPNNIPAIKAQLRPKLWTYSHHLYKNQNAIHHIDHKRSPLSVYVVNIYKAKQAVASVAPRAFCISPHMAWEMNCLYRVTKSLVPAHIYRKERK